MVHQQNAAGRKTHRARWIVLGVVVVLAVVAGAFSHFGGFGTGPSADPDELAAYAQGVDDITVPDGVKVVALGEATHGNSEFQQLKLDVFKMLVEKYDVRAFALEGDFGGCEVVNRYIHGESDTSQGAVASIGYDEATAAIGFTIYRTDEMANLVAWMRAYNETAAPGEDLRFYGFDMQRGARNMAYLIEACQNHGVDTASLYLLANGEDWSDAYAWDERIAIISAIRQELADAGASAHELHFADVLLQHCTYYQAMETESSGDSSLRRDAMMADNIQWISEQEQALGHGVVFVSAHDGHVAKTSYESMGNLLSRDFGEGYYVIGTDFYHTTCNMPFMGNRFDFGFYSYDPLAKAAKTAGLDVCWLDFSKVPADSELGKACSSYMYMGSLGEGYSPLMLVLPMTYRVYQCPSIWYDSLILVSEATPISPKPAW